MHRYKANLGADVRPNKIQALDRTKRYRSSRWTSMKIKVLLEI